MNVSSAVLIARASSPVVDMVELFHFVILRSVSYKEELHGQVVI